MEQIADVAIIGAGERGCAYQTALCEANLQVIHLDTLGKQTAQKEKVTALMKRKNQFLIMTEDKEFTAKTVIVATGNESRQVFPGEISLRGKGVSFCAICDGGLYRGKTVAVFTDSPLFDSDIQYLASMADKVWLEKPMEQLPENCRVLSAPIAAINGEPRVQSIHLENGHIEPVAGVFLLTATTAPSVFVYGATLAGEFLKVNEQGQTSVAGLFAAGSCTDRKLQLTPEEIVTQIQVFLKKRGTVYEH